MHTIVWFTNDLRVHDHEPLYRATLTKMPLIPVYIFDPRQFETQVLGFPKTGVLRTQFLLEAVADLRKQLQNSGSNLLIRVGKPEEILPQLVKELSVKGVFTSEVYASEEANIAQKLSNALAQEKVACKFFHTATLFHPDDLPFNIAQTPDVFTTFRHQVEKASKVRKTYVVPPTFRSPEGVIWGELPTIAELLPNEKSSPTLLYKGGESAALERLQVYFWEKDLLKVYKETRNEMLGLDYSSKFSVWLALGCISPRYIYEQVLAYEFRRTKNESTYWLIFELLWRDYFKWVSLKYGNRIFQEKGIKQLPQIPWKKNHAFFEKWKNGETGIPLIDANMQELWQTGFMSNRGRQNVASFLVKDLLVNWTWGAAWFESQLLDYDVCSNWGNWNYVAGVGNDPRENRYFNIYTQAKRYDSQGIYVKNWLPDLAHLPADKVHDVPILSDAEWHRLGIHYPKPLINARKWLSKEPFKTHKASKPFK